jgi:hypothetical protein
MGEQSICVALDDRTAAIQRNGRGKWHAHVQQAAYPHHEAVMISPGAGRFLTSVRESPIIDSNLQAMPGRRPFLPYVVAVAATIAAQQHTHALQDDRLEQLHRREGEALIALADAALAGRSVPADLTINWRHDVLKAQQGTFVPFVVTIDRVSPPLPAILLYVRLIERSAALRPPPADTPRGDGTSSARSRRDEDSMAASAVEEVYPVDLRSAPPGPIRVSRGFSVRAGEYDLIVVARERVDPAHPSARRRAATLTKRLTLPDFAPAELTTSSVMLADSLTVLDAAPPAEQAAERPYLIGLSEIQPAADNVFRRDEELIVVFLVYNPFVTPERKFDIEVEYHFFIKAAPGGRGGDGDVGSDTARPAVGKGERYFNHTKPQRFTPAIMGPGFDPTAGQPLMAGQGVPLAAFPEGEYRLAIRVTDVVTGKSIVRDVSFTVEG